MPREVWEEGVGVSEKGQCWEMSCSGGRDGKHRQKLRRRLQKPSVILLGKRVRKMGKAV